MASLIPNYFKHIRKYMGTSWTNIIFVKMGLNTCSIFLGNVCHGYHDFFFEIMSISFSHTQMKIVTLQLVLLEEPNHMVGWWEASTGVIKV